MPTAVLFVVTLGTLERLMSADQRPTCVSVVELALVAAWPSDKFGAASEVFDVTASTFLAAIGFAVQALLLSDTDPEVVVAVKACVGVNSAAARMTLGAVGVSFELHVITAQVTGRKELRPRCPWSQHARDRRGGQYEHHHRPH